MSAIKDFTGEKEGRDMSRISLNLITGRSIQQGVAMEGGKEKDRKSVV